MSNTIITSIIVNLLLVLYIAWLRKKANRLTRDNAEKEQVLLQKKLQIDTLERRKMIEMNNQHDVSDLDERLRSKGYL